MNKLITILLITVTQNAFAFDLEDYAGTFRATRDAHKAAHISLRLAEDSLFAILNTNRNILPMPTATRANMGTKLGSCAYLKECSEAYTKSKITAELDAILADSKINSAFDSTQRTSMKTATQNYYDAFNPDVITNQKMLLQEQSANIVYDEDINNYVFTQTGTYGFTAGATADDTLVEFRTLRNAYHSALNTWKISRAPFLAARASYAAAVQNYFNNTGCANFANALSIDDYL